MMTQRTKRRRLPLYSPTMPKTATFTTSVGTFKAQLYTEKMPITWYVFYWRERAAKLLHGRHRSYSHAAAPTSPLVPAETLLTWPTVAFTMEFISIAVFQVRVTLFRRGRMWLFVSAAALPPR